VIFDTTKTGVSSETVKSVSAALGIPTVSASFGQDGDLRQWRDIPDKKKGYLLQVMPPSDVLTEIVRSIVIYNNITNAAILYDETYVVDHKYKALLQNIPTRHVITAIAGDRERGDQIMKLRNLDINNYFILGTLESIKKVLGEFSTVTNCLQKAFRSRFISNSLSGIFYCVLLLTLCHSLFCPTCVSFFTTI
jgi:glutamate receptor, ionotropic, invertebrate